MHKHKVRFTQKEHAPFFKEIKNALDDYWQSSKQTRRANGFFWCKAALNLLIVTAAYALLVSGMVTHPALLLLAAIVYGVGCLLLIFNVAHDAVHGTLFTQRWANTLLYRLCFIPVGISGRLWAMRHLHSHHVLTNVNGSDIDIDENPFLRLSPNHPRRAHQRYQHLYAPLVYAIALPHTTFYQDVLYLFKKDLANMRNITHPWYEYGLFILEKMLYFTLIFVIPLAAIDLPIWQILTGYAIMSAAVSMVFVLTLVGTHFSMETEFPTPNTQGMIEGCWARHALHTSLDWNPDNRFYTACFGGANAHAAHHLFPTVCHVHYARITHMIRLATQKYGIPYHETTLLKMLVSHFRFLKNMATA